MPTYTHVVQMIKDHLANPTKQNKNKQKNHKEILRRLTDESTGRECASQREASQMKFAPKFLETKGHHALPLEDRAMGARQFSITHEQLGCTVG